MTAQFELRLPRRCSPGADDFLLLVQASIRAAVVEQDEGLALPAFERLRAHFGFTPPSVWAVRSALVATGHLKPLGQHLFVTAHPRCPNGSGSRP